MGNNAGALEDEDNSQRRFRTAATTVGVLARYTGQGNRDRKRAELKATLEMLKKEKEMMYLEFEKEENTDPMRFNLNTSDDSETVLLRNSNHPSGVLHDSDDCCHVCGKLAKVDGYPCRICSRVFHKHCIEKSGQCRNIDLELLSRAHTNIGWSCYICSNLSLLLTQDELNHIIETFDAYDTDKDSSISWIEYQKHQDKRHKEAGGRDIPEMEVERLHLDFKLADTDGDGQLDWWEFVNHDAKMMLMKRPKEDLVNMLTDKEVQMAKDMFSALDTNHDGKITEMEARDAFRAWFKNVRGNDSLGTSRAALETYVTVSTRMIMHSEDSVYDVLTWPIFLSEQALYLICNRPNMVNAKSLWNQ